MKSLAKLLLVWGVFGVTGLAFAVPAANPVAELSTHMRPACECHMVGGTIVCTCIRR